MIKISNEAIAIDVVLLPDDAVNSLALQYNEQLCKQGSTLRLDDEHVPHISLYMGLLSEIELKELQPKLDHLALCYDNVPLLVEGLEWSQSNDKDMTCCLAVKNRHELQAFHSKISWDIQSLQYDNRVLHPITTTVQQEHFADDEIAERTKQWVQYYHANSSNHCFSPHITVGFGNPPLQLLNEFPIEFTPSKMAVYQLGNHCTCKKELFELDLSDCRY